MWRHYVYLHFRENTGEPFYVGKGSARKHAKMQKYLRAFEERHSNKDWLGIVKTFGFRVEIFASCKTDEEAQRVEQELIDLIGRRDLGRGPLINKTDGGDGSWGLIASEQLRKKRSENAKGPRSPVWVTSIRVSRKNGGNGGVVKKGDKLPESWRKSISIGLSGENNAWYGKPTPASRKVKNRKTGTVYPTIKLAAKAEGINRARLYNYFYGNSHFTDCRHLEKL